MAVAAIVPQPQPLLRLLADALTLLHANTPAFARALRRAVAHAEAGIAYEPYTLTHYRVQSMSRPWLWHYVTLHACSCGTPAPWCWHRALLHLLTAQAALTALARCPRPTLAHVPPRPTALPDLPRLLVALDGAATLEQAADVAGWSLHTLYRKLGAVRVALGVPRASARRYPPARWAHLLLTALDAPSTAPQEAAR